DGALRRPGRLLAAALLLVGVAAPGLTRLEVDNSPRAFLVRDGRLLRSLDDLRSLFGGGPALRLAWSGDGLWTAAGLAWLERATREAAAVPGVVAAHGPLELAGWWEPARRPSEVGRRLRDDPLARAGGWVDAEGDFASVLVELEAGLSRREGRRALDALVTLARAAPAGLRGSVVGLPAIERAMDRSFARLARRLFPWLGIVCALLLVAAFRSVVDAALPLAAVAVSEAVLLGLMGWSGVRLNVISSLLPPVVFVLGLAVAVHLQMAFRFHRGRGLDPPAAARAAVRERAWAIFWTAFTTAAAFLSFAFSRLPAVRSLGLWTAAGIGLILVASALFQAPAMALLGAGSAPASRPGIGPPVRAFDRLGGRLGRRLATRAALRGRSTIAVMALIGGLAAAGLPRLEVETGLLGYFPAGHELPASFAAIEAHGVGAVPAELVLRLPPGAAAASFRDPERLERLADLAAALRSQAPILGAVGAGDLFRAAGRRAIEGGPASDGTRWLVLGLLQTEPEARRRFEQLVTADGRDARVTLLLPVAGHEVLLPALERAAARARADFPEARVEWTGEYPLVLAAQRDLLSTMAASLGLTALVVASVLAFVLRSAARWAAAMVANLWPLAVAGGVMGWAGIPLDSTTVMIAAIALGVAVDDTLHTLGELRAAPGRSYAGRLPAAIGRVAPAQLLTTLILVLGFAGCALADFLPIARFGLLTALALAAALAGDWLLLPALLGARRSAPARSGPPNAGRRGRWRARRG
ncbi:MAG: MMPL family transporter, partial [Acidobacteriota bacterium]|nr:MMPL family transporter [Acidobacteriota bacterium]